MKKNAFIVFAVIYIPLFGQLLDGFRVRSNTLSYIPVMILFFIFTFKALKRPINIKPYFIMVFFCLMFLGISLFNWALGPDEFGAFLYSNFGFFLSLSLLVYMSTIDDINKPLFFNILFDMISIAFIIQFVLSAYESHLGYYIAYQFDWMNSIGFQGLSNRFLLNVISLGIGKSIFGNTFILTFSGLLGQHNYWGTQLPFYNLIFVMVFLRRRKTKGFVLLLLVLLASLLNTSRFGLFAILFTDLAIALLSVKFLGDDSGRLKVLAMLLLLLLLAGSFPFLVEGWSKYFQNQNTLILRTNNYPLFVKTFFLASPVNFFLGSSRSDITEQISKALGYTTSFENQILLIAYSYGLIGLGTAVYCFFSLLWQARRYSYAWKIATYLLLFNILAVTVTSNLLFHFSSLPFIVLLYMYIRSSGTKPYLHKPNSVQIIISENNP